MQSPRGADVGGVSEVPADLSPGTPAGWSQVQPAGASTEAQECGWEETGWREGCSGCIVKSGLDPEGDGSREGTPDPGRRRSGGGSLSGGAVLGAGAGLAVWGADTTDLASLGWAAWGALVG